jgi:hypothetical protein
MKAFRLVLAIIAIAGAAACTTSPTGPSHSDVTDPWAGSPT